MIRRRSRWKQWLWPAIVSILLAAAVGVYVWQHGKVVQLDKQLDRLNGQVANLQAQTAELQRAAAQQAAAQQAAANAVPPSCQGANTKLTLGPASGTAGTVYIDAIFTNKSSRACTLQGYPEAALTDANSQTLGQQATQSGSSPAASITIQPNKSAHAAAGFPDPGALSSGSCSQAAFLNVTLPGDTTNLQTAISQEYCPGFSISAITAGS